MRAVLPVIIVVVLGSLGVFAVSPSDYKSAAVFQQMGALMKTHGESLVKEVDGVFAFRVFHKEWPSSIDLAKPIDEQTILDAKNGKGGLKATGRTGAKDADVTFEATDSDLYDILTGKLDAKQAYFSGKLTIDGSIMLAMKLSKFQSPPGHDEM